MLRAVCKPRLELLRATAYDQPLDTRHEAIAKKLSNAAASFSSPAAGTHVHGFNKLLKTGEDPRGGDLRQEDDDLSDSMPTGGYQRSSIARVWGPIDLKTLRRLLRKTTSKEEILALSFRFLSQYFEYVAVFNVRKNTLAPIDATRATGANFDRIRSFRLDLSEASSFQETLEKGRPVLSEMKSHENDKEVVAALLRQHAQPAMILPVSVRQKVALLVYGDRGGEGFVEGDVIALHHGLTAIGDAFESLILRMKIPKAPKVPSIPGGNIDTGATNTSSDAEKDISTPQKTSNLESQKSDAAIESRRPSPLSSLPAPRADEPTFARRSLRANLNVLGVRRSAPPPPDAERLSQYADIEIKRQDGEHKTPSSVPPQMSTPLTGDQGIEAMFEAPPPLPRKSELPAIYAKAQMLTDGAKLDENGQAALEQLLNASPDIDHQAIDSYVEAMGEHALGALISHFPGPLFFDRSNAHQRLPAGRDLSAICRTLVRFGASAAPAVASLLTTEDPDARFAAVVLAGEFRHRDFVAPLGKLTLDKDGQISELATVLLRDYANLQYDLEDAQTTIREALSSSQSLTGKISALMVVRTLGDASAITLCLPLVDASDRTTRNEALKTLISLTGQDFGHNGDEWSTWYQDNKDKHHIEWLIEGLIHQSPDVREVASAELHRVSGQYFGYHPGLPSHEREQSYHLYRAWWLRDGDKFIKKL